MIVLQNAVLSIFAIFTVFSIIGKHFRQQQNNNSVSCTFYLDCTFFGHSLLLFKDLTMKEEEKNLKEKLWSKF